MTRVEIHYGGTLYTVADRTAEQVREQIVTALENDQTLWLPVNRGEGLPREVQLLIRSGIAIAVGRAVES